MAQPRSSRPLGLGAPRPTHFGAKNGGHERGRNGGPGGGPHLIELSHQRSTTILAINVYGPHPQTAESWVSRARLGPGPTRLPSPAPPPHPSALPRTQYSAVSQTQPGALRPPTACQAPEPGLVPLPTPPPRAIVASTKGRISRSQDYRSAARPPPRACAATLLEASGRGGALTSHCCVRRGCAG